MYFNETGLHLLEAGVISGYDSTPECAVTKLMFLLGHGLSQAEIRRRMNSAVKSVPSSVAAVSQESSGCRDFDFPSRAARASLGVG